MNSFVPLKTALVSSIFALSALVTPAHSTLTDEIKDSPLCDLDFLVTETLRDKSFLPSGIKGSSAKWNLEIYTNSKTGAWVLLGQSKDPKVAPSDELCQLAFGIKPYTQTSWYQKIFAKPATNVATDKTQPQPRVN